MNRKYGVLIVVYVQINEKLTRFLLLYFAMWNIINLFAIFLLLQLNTLDLTFTIFQTHFSTKLIWKIFFIYYTMKSLTFFVMFNLRVWKCCVGLPELHAERELQLHPADRRPTAKGEAKGGKRKNIQYSIKRLHRERVARAARWATPRRCSCNARRIVVAAE